MAKSEVEASHLSIPSAPERIHHINYECYIAISDNRNIWTQVDDNGAAFVLSNPMERNYTCGLLNGFD